LQDSSAGIDTVSLLPYPLTGDWLFALDLGYSPPRRLMPGAARDSQQA
jgi:hypothetical protein